MNEVKKPTCGRMVHYFPNGSDVHCSENGVEMVPAFVVQSFGGLVANLSVFPMNQNGTNVLRYSVQHKSELGTDHEGRPYGAYWDWPAIV